MKRTALARRTPLRTRLKPSGIDLAAAERWRVAVVAGACALCGGLGPRQGHHVIRQQHLVKRARELGVDKNELLWDPRVGMPLCTYPCHSNVTARSQHIPRSLLRQEVFDFADKWGLRWLLEREYPELAA